MTRPITGKEIYSISPLYEKLLESHDNARVENGIILEKSFEKAKHGVNLHRSDKDVHHRETRYPVLDRLIEEHF